MANCYQNLITSVAHADGQLNLKKVKTNYCTFDPLVPFNYILCLPIYWCLKNLILKLKITLKKIILSSIAFKEWDRKPQKKNLKTCIGYFGQKKKGVKIDGLNWSGRIFFF